MREEVRVVYIGGAVGSDVQFDVGCKEGCNCMEADDFLTCRHISVEA